MLLLTKVELHADLTNGLKVPPRFNTIHGAVDIDFGHRASAWTSQVVFDSQLVHVGGCPGSIVVGRDLLPAQLLDQIRDLEPKHSNGDRHVVGLVADGDFDLTGFRHWDLKVFVPADALGPIASHPGLSFDNAVDLDDSH